MYYMDRDGNLRTIRSSSQLESMHRFLKEDMPGTNMGIQSADYAIVNFSFK